MLYSVVIIDDEMPARLNLRSLLSQYKDFLVAGEASNGEDALQLCRETLPDIVLLDIQLQDMTGFEIAADLMELSKTPKIVFVTAYNEYAINAFECAAADYLLKPVDEGRFLKTIQKLRDELKNNPHYALNSVHQLLERHLQLEHSNRKITLEKDGKLYVLCLKDIIYIETEERNTKVISKRGEYITTTSMAEWEERLNQHGFFRPHRSFLINLDEIDEIVLWFNNSFQVKMRGTKDQTIPISRNKLKDFKELVGLDT